MSGLEKQTVAIPFGGGKDEGTHPYLVEPPLVKTAKDVLATKSGTLVKHPGEDAINASGYPSVLAPVGLFQHDGNLCMMTHRGVESLSEAFATWRQANTTGWLPVESRTRSLRASDYPATMPDVAACGNYLGWVWAENGKVYVRIEETVSGAVALPPTAIGSLGSAAPDATHASPNPIILGRGGTEFFIVGAGDGTGGTSTGSLYYLRIPTSTMVPSALTLLYAPSAGSINGVAGWCAEDGSAATVYVTMSDGGGFAVKRVTSGAPTTTALLGAVGDRALDVYYSSFLDRLFVLTGTAAGEVQTTYMSGALGGITGPSNVWALPAGRVAIRGALCERSGSGDQFAVVETYTTAGIPSYLTSPMGSVEWANLTTAGALTGSVGVEYHLALVSKCFRSANHPPYFCVQTATGNDNAQGSAPPPKLFPGIVRDAACDAGGSWVVASGATRKSVPDYEKHAFVVAPVIDAAGGPALAIAAKAIDSGAWGLLYNRTVSTATNPNFWESAASKAAKVGADQYVFGVGRLFRTNSLAQDDLLNTWAGGWRRRITTDSLDGLQDLTEVARVAVRLQAGAKAVSVGPLTVLAAGVAGFFDSSVSGEIAVHAAPKIIELESDTSVAYAAGEKFDVALVLAWTDDEGRVHRSAPSLPATLSTLAAAGPNRPSTVYIDFIAPPTAVGPAYGKPMEVEVFRSGDLNAGGDTTLRLVHREPLVASGAVLGAFRTSVRVSSDAVIGIGDLLTSAQPLYTEGGELAAEQPPSALDATLHGGRLWLISGERAEELWPSKLLAARYTPEWSGALITRAEGDPGDFVALASMDDKLVAFKADSIWAVTGDGPNNNGEGPGFSVSRLVGDVGCISRGSVAVVPDGVMFQGRRGFYLLGRDLQVHYVGGPVEDQMAETPAGGGGGPGFAIGSFAGAPIVAAVVTPQESTARFVATDRIYLYNYVSGQWTTREESQAGACLYGDRFARIQADYTAAVEASRVDGQPSTWNSPDAPPRPVVETGWIRLPSLVGFQRVWRSEFLFRYATGDLKIEIGYDWEDSYTDTMSWSQATLDTLKAGGSDDAGMYRLIVDARPGRQKCSAIRFRISEVVINGQQPPDVGRGFELAGIALDVGVKKGARKLLPDAAKK